MSTNKRWWLSWCATDTDFESHTPWWVSGFRHDGAPTICAAVIAPTEQAAKQYIAQAHDKKPSVDDIPWRFCNEQEADWSPFCDRFPWAKWMQWPEEKEPKKP